MEQGKEDKNKKTQQFFKKKLRVFLENTTRKI